MKKVFFINFFTFFLLLGCGSGKTLSGEWYVIDPETGNADLQTTFTFSGDSFVYKSSKIGEVQGTFSFGKAAGVEGESGQYSLSISMKGTSMTYSMIFHEDKHKTMWIDMGKKLILAKQK